MNALKLNILKKKKEYQNHTMKRTNKRNNVTCIVALIGKEIISRDAFENWLKIKFFFCVPNRSLIRSLSLSFSRAGIF